MLNIDIFRNKCMEDATAKALGAPLGARHFVAELRAYVASNVQSVSPTGSSAVAHDEKQLLHANVSVSPPDASACATRFAAMRRGAGRGARAGYLAGCALTAGTDALFGTPHHEGAVPRPSKWAGISKQQRVGFGVLRARPSFDESHAADALLGRGYAYAAAVVQWAGGNAGALVVVAALACVRGAQMGATYVQRKVWPPSVWQLEREPRVSFAEQVRAAAQRGDIAGVVIFGFPLYLMTGCVIGGAMLVSAAIKGACSGVGGLMGAMAGLASDMMASDGHFRRDMAALSKSANSWLRVQTLNMVDALDGKAALRRAIAQAKRRDIRDEDIIESLTLNEDEKSVRNAKLWLADTTTASKPATTETLAQAMKPLSWAGRFISNGYQKWRKSDPMAQRIRAVLIRLRPASRPVAGQPQVRTF